MLYVFLQLNFLLFLIDMGAILRTYLICGFHGPKYGSGKTKNFLPKKFRTNTLPLAKILEKPAGNPSERNTFVPKKSKRQTTPTTKI